MSRKETPNDTFLCQQPEPLQEGLDYYTEHGRYVFTAYYLKRRGYCCQNGCRHCPYGFKRDHASGKNT